jgi:hypothetical protein
MNFFSFARFLPSVLMLVVFLMTGPPAASLVTKYCQTNQSFDLLKPFFHDLYGRTTDKDGNTEREPTWDDCNQFVEFLKQAGCSPTGWTCELRHGTCPVAGWGSCVHASFSASALCVSPSFTTEFKAGTDGVSVSVGGGGKALADVFNAAWGTATGC